MPVKSALLFPAVLLTLVVSPAARAASPGKACDLLSKASADKLFGATIKPGVEHPIAADGSASLCLYENNDKEQVNFHFQLRPEIPDNIAPTVLKTMIHKGYPSDVVEKIPGVGDDNFFITSVGNPNQDTFTVLYHKAYVTLIARGSRDANLKADMIQAMKQALAKF